MSKPKKTRISVYADDVNLEMFSVRERLSNGIVLLVATPRYMERDSSLVGFEEQHYSIHPTNAGRDICVTQKTFFSDGSTLSLASMLHNMDEKSVAPVFAHRLGVYDSERMILSARQRDTVIEIGRYFKLKSTLYYSVFVVPQNFQHPPGEYGGSTLFVVPFERYTLAVFASYQYLPTLPCGDVIALTSSTPIDNNIRNDDHEQIYLEGLPMDLIFETHWKFMGGLRNRYMERLVNMYGLDSVAVNAATSRSGNFFAKPDIQFEQLIS